MQRRQVRRLDAFSLWALFRGASVLQLCHETITTRRTTCPNRCHTASAAWTGVHINTLPRILCK